VVFVLISIGVMKIRFFFTFPCPKGHSLAFIIVNALFLEKIDPRRILVLYGIGG